MKRFISYFAVLVIGLFAFVTISNAEEVLTTGNSDVRVIYIGREGCGYCQAFIPGLKYLSEKYNFAYEYVNTDYITESELDTWLKKLNVNPDEFGTPTYGILINGKLKNSQVGFVPEEELFHFFQDNGVISSEAVYEPQFKNITYISNEEYLDIVKSGKKSFILFSQTTCSACLKARKNLDEIAKELNVKVYYYDLGFASQEEYNKFHDSNDYIGTELDNNTFNTPTYMVIKGSETIAVATVFKDKADLKNFISTNLKGGLDRKMIVIIVLSVLLAVASAYAVMNQIKINELMQEKAKRETKKVVEKEEIVKPKTVAKKTTKKVTKKK